MRALFAKALPDNPVNVWFLLLFVAVFTGIVWWTLRPSKARELDDASRLPLND